MSELAKPAVRRAVVFAGLSLTSAAALQDWKLGLGVAWSAAVFLRVLTALWEGVTPAPIPVRVRAR